MDFLILIKYSGFTADRKEKKKTNYVGSEANPHID